jgi:GNAT superfamily N-acetyltransferase
MRAVCLHDKKEIECFLRKNVDLNIYSLGDLDDLFWPYTIWYASKSGTAVRAVALLYIGQSLPTLLALSDEDRSMPALLAAIAEFLPPRFYAHLSPGLESVFENGYQRQSHGSHYKMALRDEIAVTGYDCSGAVPLRIQDLDAIQEFYSRSYPGNWFDPRMLQTGQYFGLREAGGIASVAGIHVYSPEYRVAALGNVATLPSCRGQGLAKRVTARVCQSLLKDVRHIGANVKADNAAAIRCYRRLGFEIIARYEEFMVTKR